MGQRHGSHLETTSRAVLDPIGAFGEPVWRNSDQIRETLRSRLSPAHADLFAIPRQREDGISTDWFSPCEGQAVRWVDLSTDEKRRYAEIVEAYVRDIAAATNRLRASGARGAGMICDSIDAAGYVGSTEHLYIVGEQPVATAWGMKVPGEPSPPSVLPFLSQYVLQSEMPTMAGGSESSAPTVRSFPWKMVGIGSILVLILLLIVLVWTLHDRFSPMESGSSAPDTAEVGSGVSLVIPEQAIADGDVSFLAGRWTSVSDLISIETGEGIVVEYEFDAEGQGRAWVVESHQSCATSASAFFSGRNLVIREDAPARCPDGRGYVRTDVICTVGTSGGTASCIASQEGVEDIVVDMLRH